MSTNTIESQRPRFHPLRAAHFGTAVVAAAAVVAIIALPAGTGLRLGDSITTLARVCYVAAIAYVVVAAAAHLALGLRYREGMQLPRPLVGSLLGGQMMLLATVAFCYARQERSRALLAGFDVALANLITLGGLSLIVLLFHYRRMDGESVAALVSPPSQAQARMWAAVVITQSVLSLSLIGTLAYLETLPLPYERSQASER